MPLHTQSKRPHAAIDEPGRVGIDRLPPQPHEAVDLFDKGGGPGYRAGNDVAVAVEVLGGAGNDDVGSMLERPEVERAGKGGVDQESEPFFLRYMRAGT